MTVGKVTDTVTLVNSQVTDTVTFPPFSDWMPVLKTVGARIQAARRARKLSQEELAEKVGVAEKSVSRWENDRQMPPEDYLTAIGKALLVPPMWIRYGDEGPTVEGLLISDIPGLKEPPRVSKGLPQRIRAFIQGFLLELVNADVPEERVETIRRILSSDEMYRFYVGGEPQEYSEDETLEGIQAHAEAFRQRLRRQGFKLAK